MGDFNPEQTIILQKLISQKFGIACAMNEETVKGIKDAITQGADPCVCDTDTFQNTALIWAIVCRQTELAAFLINHAKSNDSLNKAGEMISDNTPLMLCIKKRFFDLAFQLLEKGVDVNGITDENKSLHDPEIVEMALSPLHLSILMLGGSNEAASVPQFNDAPFLNQESSKNNYIALEKKLILMLIEKGANLETKDKFGRTPLDYLNQPLYEEDTYFCESSISFKEYCGIPKDAESPPEVTEKEKEFLIFLKQRSQFMRTLLGQSMKDVEAALKQFEKDFDPIVIEYFRHVNTRITARELIDSKAFCSLKDIQDSKRFQVACSPKGGDSNITLLLTHHLDLHQAIWPIITSRTAYLNTPDHKIFCQTVSDTIARFHLVRENDHKLF